MNEFIYIRSEKRYIQLPLADIVYIKAKKHRTKIITEQETYMVYNTLQAVYDQLPKELFFRIHLSYVVPLRRVKAFDLDMIYLHEPEQPYPNLLARVRSLPLGINRKQELRASVKILQTREKKKAVKEEQE